MNEISIIGGGLSGLHFAYRMTKENTNLAPTIHIYEKMKHFVPVLNLDPPGHLHILLLGLAVLL